MRFNPFFFVLVLSLFIIHDTYAQTFTIQNGTVSTCGGTFVDSGGNAGQYSPNENFEYTICSTNGAGNTHVTLSFQDPNVDPSDQLCFYDGDDTSAPFIGCLDILDVGQPFTIQATAQNPSGCLTVTFTSDGTTESDGFEATIGCVQSCQPVIAMVNSANPPISPADTGWIDICPGDIVEFFGGADYPLNNFTYPQSDATSTFEWSFGDGDDGFGPNVQHVYNEPGGYLVQLLVTDSEGCQSLNLVNQRIRVSGPPNFNLLGNFDDELCVGDTIRVYTGVDDPDVDISIAPGSGTFQSGGVVADTVALPDGSGVSYQSCLQLNEFTPSQTLNNIDDFLSLCMNIEHSYIGDLDIVITCPGGQSVTLLDYPNNGAGAYLGIPVDNDADLTFGEGYDYCFTSDATEPLDGDPFPFGAPSGVPRPEGDYASEQSLTGLLGCPLNGEWCITITDNIGSDNGVIFNWSIELNEDIYPNLETYDLEIVNAEWSDNSSIFINTPDSMFASPSFPGSINYVFETTDNFGCVYDTLINVNVLPQTDPSCFSCSGNLVEIPDVTICDDETASLTTDIENVSLTSTTFQNSPNSPFTNGNPFNSIINVSGLPYNNIDAASIENVCLNIDHTFPFDVVIQLQSPSGTVIDLTRNNNNGFMGTNFEQTCFTPSAASSITTAGAPYTGDWLPQNDFSAFTGDLSNGNWTLIVSDAFPGAETGVLLDWTITFNLNNFLDWSWSPTTGLSCTDCPNPTFTPPSDGSYSFTITGTDQLNCSYTEDVIVTVNDCSVACNLSASQGTLTDETCPNDNDGSVVINTTGGTPPLSFNLDAGAVIQTDDGNFTGIAPGNHQVVVTDANLCTSTVNFTIAASSPITLTLTPTDISCSGQDDGSILATASGGNGTLTYLWNDPNAQTSSTASNLEPNTYSVTVTDANGCTAIASETVSEDNPIVPVLNNTPVLCSGDNDGTATVSASGGVSPYSYLWNNGQTTATITGLSGGNYSVVVTDADGCTSTGNTTITEPTMALGISSLTQTQIGCDGSNEGEVTVVAEGGTPPYSYSWDNGGTTDVIDNLAPNTYSVTITDANSCTFSDNITIIENPAITIETTKVDIDCNGNGNGTATSTATGGTPPFTYLWSNSSTTSTITNLDGGAYFVTATDANGCSIVDSVFVVEPTALNPFFVFNTELDCNGDSDANIAYAVEGGTSPYVIEWSTGDIFNTVSNIKGNWELDANNCLDYFSSDSVNLLNDTICILMTDGFNIDSTNVVISTYDTDPCLGSTIDLDNDGVCNTIDPDDNDPCTPYSFDLDNNGVCDFIEAGGPITQHVLMPISSSVNVCFDIPSEFDSINTTFSYCVNEIGSNVDNLAAGNYSVTVTDGNGCTISTTYDIIDPPLLVLSATQTNVSCLGGNDGTATVIPTGGTGAYTYLWDDASAQTTDVASGLIAGTYNVIVTDANGCQESTSVTITEPNTAVQINSLSQTSIGCDGSGEGIAEVSGTGGTPPYTFAWSSGGTSSIESNLPVGDVFVTVTDTNGCEVLDTLSIVEYAPLSFTLIGTEVSCFGGNDGTISIDLISGGAGSGNPSEYSYNWENIGQTSSTVTGISAGTYSLTITDLEGCTAVNQYTVNEPSELLAGIVQDTVSCSNSADGELAVVPSGGTSPYSYQWSPNALSSTDSLVTGLLPGGYSVTVTDALGCTAVGNSSIQPVEPIDISFNVIDNICFGGSQGEINVTVTGGTPDYTFIWSTGDTLTTSNISSLPAGSYDVTIVDANGCTFTNGTVIEQPSDITSSATTESVSCFGDRDGSMDITASGGTIPYTYSIGGAFSSPSTLVGLEPDSYDVVVMDNNGCTDTIFAVVVQEPAQVEVFIQPDTNIIEIPLGDSIQLGLVINNNLGNTIIGWDPLYTPGNISCLDCADPWITTFENNRYEVTVIDENGCMASDEIRIQVIRDNLVFVPSGFTPNNDLMNDVLMVHGKTGTKVLTFRVYDRWGELVFRADDYDINSTMPSHVWDGRFAGNALNSAVFTWFVEVQYLDGRKESFTGNTTLLR